jgi:hypothetical protein
MTPFAWRFLVFFVFDFVALVGIILACHSVEKMSYSAMEFNKKIIIKASSKNPEKFTALDISTLDCRVMGMKWLLAFAAPTACYAQNKDGVEVDITDLFESVAKEQAGK